MVAPGENCTDTSVLLPCPTPRPLSQKSKQRPHGKSILFKQVKPAVAKGIVSESRQRFFTHGLRHLQHFSCDSPVRFMMYSEAAAAFISLHTGNTVCLYKDGDHKHTLSLNLPFMGLTATKIHGCIVGWGPGPIFTLMDSEFFPLDAAQDALDIRVCQAAEHSTELVTAGAGNVCVWSVMLMRCRVRIQEGLQESEFTHMALSPPRSARPHRAFLVCGQVVMVVDLDGRRVLEHKKNLCSCSITAVAYCFELDYLIIASQELSITVWGPDWNKRATFSGHNDVVNSLFYCSDLSMLMSSSADCTIRCWNVENCEAVDCISTDQDDPPLYIGGTGKGDNYFTFSHKGVDFWTTRSLYTLCCRLRRDIAAPMRQILVSSYPAPYPTRVLCVSGDSNITLLAAETGAVLTSFKTKSRILCADYCLPKEILLVLTETGTVLQANTLTNPITLMQEWKGRGQGPWQLVDHVTEQEVHSLTTPGPACCMALYSYVPETEKTLEEWTSLQKNRVVSQKSNAARDDAKDMFLIILGQSGGCVSVLKMNNGKVLYRTPAHDGKRVTSVQVYPENNYLLSTGEDLTVVVWTVNPHIKECLTQQLSLHCNQPQIHLAVLGSQLALSYEEPSSSSYILKHFSLHSQSQTDYHPKKGHSDQFTGLCGLPDLNVFVSSSLDKTVRFWDKENRLIRTLEVNAVPECIAHSAPGDELFLGIRGNLYRMNCARFLPYSYQQTLHYMLLAEPPPDLPPTGYKETCTERHTSENEEEESQAIARNPLSTKDVQQQKETLITSNMDLKALLKGTVKCKKEKPPSTKKTRKEAFDCYMKRLYGLSNHYKIDLEDTFDRNKFLVNPVPVDIRPSELPTIEEYMQPHSTKSFPVNVKKKKKEKAPATLMKVKPPPVEKLKTPDIEHPKTISPIEEPKPRTPTPPHPHPSTPTPPPHLYRTTTPPHPPTPRLHHRTPTPLPIREPSPQMAAYLRQFEGMCWFTELYPDKKSIPGYLSPEDFSLLLLNHLQNCNIHSRIKLLAAVQTLHRQGLLQNTDKLYQGLVDCINKFATPDMSPLERTMLVDMLNLLVQLESDSAELMKKLLTLLAYKELDLRETIMGILSLLGVGQAEHWLWPEVESWDSVLQGQTDTWKSLHDKAESWLYLWISKLKEHNRYLHLRSKTKWIPPSFTMVDVLNYFCSVQKEVYRKSRYVAPAGRKDTVLLPLYDCSQPIVRLGETHSMTRTRKPTGLILPPLRDHPFLGHVPKFISLPLPRITLRPFHVYSDEDWVKVPTRHYFILQQSWVEYYR